MVSVLQDERDRQLAHSGPHIEVHPEDACVPPPESGLGSSHGACPYWRPPSAPYVCRAGTFSAGGLLHFAREVCMAGPVNRACEDLRGLTSGWSGPASAGRSPAIHSASA
jgi:hypothetical protein